MATAKPKSNRVTVEAYTNLDWLNQGEQMELDRDEWVDNLVKAGYLKVVTGDEIKEETPPGEVPTGGNDQG